MRTGIVLTLTLAALLMACGPDSKGLEQAYSSTSESPHRYVVVVGDTLAGICGKTRPNDQPLLECKTELTALNGLDVGPELTVGQEVKLPVAYLATPLVVPTAQSITLNQPLSNSATCEASASALYCVYTVQAGDNLGIIATRFGLRGNENLKPWELLVWSNRPDVSREDDLLRNGQKLRVPAQPNSVIHTVLASQTLKDIAEMYGVQPENILGVAANGLKDAGPVPLGKELLIPNPKHLGTRPSNRQSSR